MDLLSQYYIEVEQIIMSESSNKEKTSQPKLEDSKLSKIVTLYNAWSEIVNYMFEFKRIYTKPKKSTAERYFVRCFDMYFKNNDQGLKDIFKVQEFIHK